MVEMEHINRMGRHPWEAYSMEFVQLFEKTILPL